MKFNPFAVVAEFEHALCEYTGAPYAVTTNSCTMAILIALKAYFAGSSNREIIVPKRTYVSVPMSVINAGGKVKFMKMDWLGNYQLSPSPVVDSARYFTSGMYLPGAMQCVSFHTSKILGDSQGGAVLLDDYETYRYLKRLRFDGREEGVAPKDDNFNLIGYHCYMSPDVAARLLHKLSVLPLHNKPLPNDAYPDLSKFEVFYE